MLAPQALIRGIVQRLLPPQKYDDQDTDRSVRLERYGGIFTQPAVRKSHVLADEGSYFVTHNAQTGIATSLLGTAFAQTTLSPVLIITNTDSGDKGKSIYLDYLHLICTTAGAAASGLTNLLFAWSIDQTNGRYTSGGTDLTASPAANGGILSPNSGVSKRGSVAQINFGALTLAAATANARLIIPQRQLRQLNSATAMCVAQDHTLMTFGNVEQTHGSTEQNISAANTNAITKQFPLPPIIIAPQHCAILHLWSPGAALTTGITFLPEMGHWER